MAIISYDDFSSLRERHPDKVIVFCSGSFDLCHAGHVLFFEDCKNLGDVLFVAVGSDKDISGNKGPDRPVLNEHARLKIVDSLKPVDYSLISNPTPPGAHHLAPIKELFERLRPDIWAVNADASEIELRRELAGNYGVCLVVLDRTAPPEYEGISTTSIIKKISGR